MIHWGYEPVFSKMICWVIYRSLQPILRIMANGLIVILVKAKRKEEVRKERSMLGRGRVNFLMGSLKASCRISKVPRGLVW